MTLKLQKQGVPLSRYFAFFAGALCLTACAPWNDCAVEATRVYARLGNVKKALVVRSTAGNPEAHMTCEWQADGWRLFFDPANRKTYALEGAHRIIKSP